MSDSGLCPNCGKTASCRACAFTPYDDFRSFKGEELRLNLNDVRKAWESLPDDWRWVPPSAFDTNFNEAEFKNAVLRAWLKKHPKTTIRYQAGRVKQRGLAVHSDPQD